MEAIKVIIVSIMQGIAEFLPISSSGHILLFKKILGLDLDLSFDLTIHLGTLLSVIIVYRQDIYELITGLLRKSFDSNVFQGRLNRTDVFKIYGLFIIATIPAGVAGVLLSDFIGTQFTITNNQIFFVLAGCFVYTGLILLASGFINKKETVSIKNMNVLQALCVGIFQALAVLPGISRSGSTISGALFAGVDRRDAGRFSFLLSIPIILAAFLFEALDVIVHGGTSIQGMVGYYFLGFVVSCVTGYIALKLLLKLIARGKIWYFSLYLIVPVAVSLFFALHG